MSDYWYSFMAWLSEQPRWRVLVLGIVAGWLISKVL